MPLSMDMSQRVNQMTQSILSRATLTNIINTHSLYPRERKRLPIEDIIEDMRGKAINVGLIGGGVSNHGCDGADGDRRPDSDDRFFICFVQFMSSEARLRGRRQYTGAQRL